MKKTLLAAMLVLPLSISAAYAQDNNVTISGYGSLGYTRSNTNDAQFVRPNQSHGVGTKGNIGVDTNLGLQVTDQITDKFSLTGQTLIRKDGADDFGAELAWAFAKYKINDNLSVRVGRLGLPVYMISDYRNVGYANTMLRPPIEVYSQVAFGHIDGVDLTYQHNVGDWALTGQVAVGQTKSEIANFGYIRAKREVALNLVAENGPLTLRLGRVDAHISSEDATNVNSLFSTLRAVGYTNLANDLVVDDKKASFTSVGATLDWKNILVQTEYAKRKTDSFIADTSSWYVMTGYRFGNVLPYYVHSTLKQDSARSTNVVPAVGALAPLAAGVNSILSPDDQTSNSVGVRWDFKKNLALKVQVDRINPHGGNGLFVNNKPGFTGPVTVVGAAVDFVF